METFLRGMLPKLLPSSATFEVYPHQGKRELLAKLGNRLRGYAPWLPPNYRIVVVVDCDQDDCIELKRRMEKISCNAGLTTRTAARKGCWRVVNRIAIEELEAWYFGDWSAVEAAYRGVPPSIPQQAAFRNVDAILGGTWEAFERVLQRAGYFKEGLRKIELARAMSYAMDPLRNRSHSFAVFRDAMLEAVGAAEQPAELMRKPP